jgi:hypothetical protein
MMIIEPNTWNDHTVQMENNCIAICRTKKIPNLKYRTISMKSTGGVTRDPIYLFDISTLAKVLRDYPKIFNIQTSKFPEINLFGHF